MYRYTDTKTIMRRCENDLHQARLVADSLALSEAQHTPRAFIRGEIEHARRIAAQDAKRMVWC